MQDTPLFNTIGTHDGVFHADDVFAIATLQLLFPNAKFIRTRDEQKLQSCDLIVDVGREYDHVRARYDHHQQGYRQAHENGILRCGFGLIWLHYGLSLAISEYVFNKIDNTLVSTIDALDNGQSLYDNLSFGTPIHTVTEFIENRNPVGQNLTNEDYDKAFFGAVLVASDYLKILINKYQNKESDNRLFLSSYSRSEDPRLVVLDIALDSGEAEMEQPELIYAISPRVDGAWNIKAVPIDEAHRFENRLPFPVSWRGKTPEELKEITGINTIRFCHATGFMAVADDKNDAILIAKKSLEQLES